MTKDANPSSSDGLPDDDDQASNSDAENAVEARLREVAKALALSIDAVAGKVNVAIPHIDIEDNAMRMFTQNTDLVVSLGTKSVLFRGNKESLGQIGDSRVPTLFGVQTGGVIRQRAAELGINTPNALAVTSVIVNTDNEVVGARMLHCLFDADGNYGALEFEGDTTFFSKSFGAPLEQALPIKLNVQHFQLARAALTILQGELATK